MNVIIIIVGLLIFYLDAIFGNASNISFFSMMGVAASVMNLAALKTPRDVPQIKKTE